MRSVRFRALLLASLGLTVSVAGCWTRQTRPQLDPPPAGVPTTRIDYVDADGFDALLESALVNQDPAITIRTDREKPDWEPRLNAWIAAWNRGGPVDGRKARGQAPILPKSPVDADSIREFRTLIDDLMNRVDDSAKAGSAWWAEERTRNRRVALLKPYNLRFHIGEDEKIQIILFNGRYAPSHPDFVRALTDADGEDKGAWVRSYQCSRCRLSRLKAEDRPRTEGKLTSIGAD
jgi:hypothetical protein